MRNQKILAFVKSIISLPILFMIGCADVEMNQSVLEVEPYCNHVYLKDDSLFKDYIEKEQPDTNYDLGSKLATFEVKPFNDVLIEFDVSMLNNTNFTQIFLQLPNILQESGEPDSDFILDIFKIKTKTLDNQVDTLVNSVCK